MSDKIRKIIEIIKKDPIVEFAYLFGSVAKGIAGERSDWDIAIYFKKDPKELPSWSVFYLEAEISREIAKEAQVVTLNNLDSPVFLFQIIKDGLLLVDKNPESRIIWETKVLRRYHDWHYFLKKHMTPVKSSA